MTKTDLKNLAKMYPNMWTCTTCIQQILPIDATTHDKDTEEDQEHTNKHTHSTGTNTNNTIKIDDTKIDQRNPYPKLKFGEDEISRVTNIKFLGVILNDTLNWTDHINYITSKINKNIGYFYRARRILERQELLNLFNSFIEPYITYCLPVWGGYVNMDSKTNPITKALNRIKRIMTFSKRMHIANNKITLLNLKQYYTLEMAKTAHKHMTDPDNSPTVYHSTLTLVSDIHKRHTRTAARINLVLPNYNSNYKKHSFHYNIATVWNSLPYPVKLKDSKPTFVGAVRRFLSEQ